MLELQLARWASLSSTSRWINMGHDFWKEPLLLNFPPPCIFLGASSTTSQVSSSVIKLERRQTPLRPPSPKLSNSHHNNLDGWTALQVRGQLCILFIYLFFFAVSVSLRETLTQMRLQMVNLPSGLLTFGLEQHSELFELPLLWINSIGSLYRGNTTILSSPVHFNCSSTQYLFFYVI